MNIIKSLLFFLLVSYSGSTIAGSYQQDTEMMLNSLLNIKNEKYMRKNKDGKKFYNSLLAYNDWEDLYIKYSKFDNKNKFLTVIEMKNLLFIAYIAKRTRAAATSEAFSSDLIPIYNVNKLKMLTILSELKFLIPSTCYYLNNYFGFEGENINLKQPFIHKNKAIIIKKLGITDGKRCLEYFASK